MSVLFRFACNLLSHSSISQNMPTIISLLASTFTSNPHAIGIEYMT
jgi:hypothetical protein